MSQLILYDLPSRGQCAAWSLNPWKTRLALNYKGIDYKTEWVDYPDIEAKWTALNIPPGTQGIKPYTIPMVRFADGRHMQDSWPIAHELEKLYPMPEYPALQLDYKNLNEVAELTGKMRDALLPCWIAKIARNVLDEKNAEYFYRTRKELLGLPIDELEAESGNDEAWEESRPSAEKLNALLDAEDGPFFMGHTPSYADFVVAGFVHFLGKAEAGFIKKIYRFAPQFEPLYEACKPWLERDDY